MQGSEKLWHNFLEADSKRVISSTSGKLWQVEETNLTLDSSKGCMIMFGQVDSPPYNNSILKTAGDTKISVS